MRSSATSVSQVEHDSLAYSSGRRPEWAERVWNPTHAEMTRFGSSSSNLLGLGIRKRCEVRSILSVVFDFESSDCRAVAPSDARQTCSAWKRFLETLMHILHVVDSISHQTRTFLMHDRTTVEQNARRTCELRAYHAILRDLSLSTQGSLLRLRCSWIRR
jgi:hypothetical protein